MASNPLTPTDPLCERTDPCRPPQTRRDFLTQSTALAAGLSAAGLAAAEEKKPLFKISLAQWSLHRAFNTKKLDPIDFAKIARDDYGIEAIEYVNKFYKGKGTDSKYLADLKKRADDNGVKSVLIMCDGDGKLGDPDEAKRKQESDAGLAYFKDCRNLTALWLLQTQVSDVGLAHFKDCKSLTELRLVRSKVSGLAPLKDLRLEVIRLTPRTSPPQGMDILRAMKSLKTIGISLNQAWPAAEFWERYDKGEFTK